MDVLNGLLEQDQFVTLAFCVGCLVLAVLGRAAIERRVRRRLQFRGNVVPMRRPRKNWRGLTRIATAARHPLSLLITAAAIYFGYEHFLVEPPAKDARHLAGHATHVRDGDTIEVNGVPVRLAKLDCAELGTSAGQNAKLAMQRLVRGESLSCSLTGRRSYDRMIGECRIVGGADLGETMIAEGYCARWR